ncbi:hypothetical protein ACFL96_01780 [Thermoproteota archaeon]
MKLTLKKLKTMAPNISETIIERHLSYLNDRYFEYFTADQQIEHLHAVAELTPSDPVKIIFWKSSAKLVNCTVISSDYPYVFSLICGILGSAGLNIQSGEVFTYQKEAFVPSTKRYRRDGITIKAELKNSRRIIDHFSGHLSSSISFEKWRQTVQELIQDIFLLLEQGGESNLVEARGRVNRIVAEKLWQLKQSNPPHIYPMELHVDLSCREYTRFKITTHDTPFFLYSLASAFAQHQVSIEHVQINTVSSQIEDTIDVVSKEGKKITNSADLDQLKLAVMLTKQFTYFLDRAPNPYDALSRFGELVSDTINLPKRGQWIELLSNRRALQDMARVLGASDFLWEDFIRLHYESLIPILKSHVEPERFYYSRQDLEEHIKGIMKKRKTYEAQIVALNEFKDLRIFLIDLYHILQGIDYNQLADQLTLLADVFISTIVEAGYRQLTWRYGKPKTIGGLEVKYAVLGLGKYGGGDLGYGSDIELIFVYSDSGYTDGPEVISNEMFFSNWVKEINKNVYAKQDGTFKLDLRLRPYGQDGSLAVSLESFCTYYGPGGAAHFYERLSLIRMRPVWGEPRFGRRLKRLRDQFLYSGGKADIRELWDLRKKQYKEKCRPNWFNAKYGLGGLVDIEYTVLGLQIMHGTKIKELRTSSIRKAMDILKKASVLSEKEWLDLCSAYGFFRKLVNGLRMLRGSAGDLELPKLGSEEYDHLARRVGYEPDINLDAAQRLNLDVQTYSAIVRLFIRKRFHKKYFTRGSIANVADLVLVKQVSEEAKMSILGGLGFKDPVKAYKNLKEIKSYSNEPDHFARLAILACDWLSRKSDQDRALNNWERFTAKLDDPDEHFNLLLKQPMRLDILLDVFSVSQFLSDTLINNPKDFQWLSSLKRLDLKERRNHIEADIEAVSAKSRTHKRWCKELRALRKREMLRIAIRDISLKAPLTEITAELTLLAEVIIYAVLERIWKELKHDHCQAVIDELKEHFCILAMGKLGGCELNYSSDIDLVVLYNHEIFKESNISVEKAETILTRVVNQMRHDLADYTEDGIVYRVDFRLRPYGQSGSLVTSVSHLVNYYDRAAGAWEIQALLKARPVGGNWWLGFEFIYEAQKKLSRWINPDIVVSSIKYLRKAAITRDMLKRIGGLDIKNSEGGLRDIEFLVQGLQLMHVNQFPELFNGNTLVALQLLQEREILPVKVVSDLTDDYIFFRRIEHFLQILEDRQNYTLPADEQELEALAKRLLGRTGTADLLLIQLETAVKRVRECLKFLHKSTL